jgi:hypothetical protein
VTWALPLYLIESRPNANFKTKQILAGCLDSYGCACVLFDFGRLLKAMDPEVEIPQTFNINLYCWIRSKTPNKKFFKKRLTVRNNTVLYSIHSAVEG